MPLPHDKPPEPPIWPIEASGAVYCDLLTDEYAKLTLRNQLMLDDFNPNYEYHSYPLEVDSCFSEAEDLAPLLTASLKERMLWELGLGVAAVEQDETDPTVKFKHVYTDGSVTQLVHVFRDDGTELPILSYLTPLAHDNGELEVAELEVLSFREEQLYIKKAKRFLEEERLDERLSDLTEPFEEINKLLDLSFEEKQDLLLTYDQLYADIQAQPTAELQPAELVRIRRQLIGAIVPAFGQRKRDKAPDITARYVGFLKALSRHYEMGTDERQDLWKAERVERLKGLNQQVERRRRVGQVITILSAACIAAAMAGGSYELGDLGIGGVPAFDGIVGASTGLVFGFRQIANYRQRSRRVQDFQHTPRPPKQKLQDEVTTEYVYAKGNLSRTAVVPWLAAPGKHAKNHSKLFRTS